MFAVLVFSVVVDLLNSMIQFLATKLYALKSIPFGFLLFYWYVDVWIDI